jgi:NADPH-dependent stearoyl-CoA 9-desaturase
MAISDVASFAHLSTEDVEALGSEFDEIRRDIEEVRGEKDAAYIRRMISIQRRLIVAARVTLFASMFPPAWVAGTTMLAAGKILENMEIGHNVMHGQWDWMNDPVINSKAWDWDTASTAEAWRHSHNFIHHTYTNIRGKDRDLGYEIMRVDPSQKWYPFYLLQPFYNIVLASLFEWGVAFHDLDIDAIRSGEKDGAQVRKELKGIAGKARAQIVKDYIAWPLISGGVMTLVELGVLSAKAREESQASGLGRKARRALRKARNAVPGDGGDSVLAKMIARRSFREPFVRTLTANVVANLMRNVWSYAIIFCGHFPDQTFTFTQEETADETRGAWYVRQLCGAANIDGGPMFHVISGNLGYQVEHHLFPDMPSTRYGEIAPKVREICERYQLPYNAGPFHQQLGMVQRTILRLALPGGKPRPKPGPYEGPRFRGKGEHEAPEFREAA